MMDGSIRDLSALADQRRSMLLSALVSCVLIAAFANDASTANPKSRLATIDALVHDRTFAIDRSAFVGTIDKVKLGDRFYSSKPPVLSTIGGAIYGILHVTTGLSLRQPHNEGAIKVLSLLLGGVPHIVLLAYAYLFLRAFVPSHARVWSFACFAFGHLGLAYATSINNHMPAGIAVFVAFYYAHQIRHSPPMPRRYFIYAGGLAGLAPTLDFASLALSVAITLYLLTFDWRRTFRWFAPAALVPLAAHFVLTWRISGSLKPIYLRPSLYLYEGSYWNAPTGLDASDDPRWLYLYNITFGHHGIFSMTPVLIFAVIAMVAAIRHRDRFHAEALVVLLPFVAMLVFYTVMTKNYGGACAGFRWLLPAVPLLLLFVARWLSVPRRRSAMILFVLLLTVGQYHAMSALSEPWRPSTWEQLIRGS